MWLGDTLRTSNGLPMFCCSLHHWSGCEINPPNNSSMIFAAGNLHLSSGWWLSPTPLKNDGVRQMGVLFHIWWKVIKFHGSKPPSSDYQPSLTIINHHEPRLKIHFPYHQPVLDLWCSTGFSCDFPWIFPSKISIFHGECPAAPPDGPTCDPCQPRRGISIYPAW